MIIDVNTKAVCQIDIDHQEAFRVLCKTLHMDCVLDEDTNYFVYRDGFGDTLVCRTRNGHDECVTDRGDLFLALRNLAVEIFPNVGFRHMIRDYRKEEWC